MKKTICIFIAIAAIMSTSLLSCGDDVDGGGTGGPGVDEKWELVADTDWYSDGPVAFNINRSAQLAGLAKLVNDGNNFQGKTITQTADLDLAGKFWTPIGTENNPFMGRYDGSGRSISGLKITSIFDNNQGLFGYIGDVNNTGNINDNILVDGVKLLNVSISGSHYVGALAGRNHGTIQNCSVAGSINGNGRIGGVAGSSDGTGSAVTSCSFSGSITGGEYVGGVLGFNNSRVESCSAAGSVTGSAYQVGGVVGYNEGTGATVTRCSFSGSVTGFSHVGGIAGNNNKGSSVVNCYAASEVEARLVGSYFAGGIAGVNETGSSVANCYATGSVKGAWVCGIANNGNITDSVALNTSLTGSYESYRVCRGGTSINNYGRSDMLVDGETVDSDSSSSVLNGKHGKSVDTENYKDQDWWTTPSNWSGDTWDFDNVWAWGTNDLPVLQ